MDIDLEQARRRAKELLRAARRGETRLRGDREPLLADAQRAVARDLGFPSWPALVAHVEASQGDRQERRRRLMAAALGGRDDLAERLLAHDPALANAGLDVALVLGARLRSPPRWTPTPSWSAATCPTWVASRSPVPAIPCSCAPRRHVRPACAARSSCCSTAAPR
jgi:hypothetical protein